MLPKNHFFGYVLQEKNIDCWILKIDHLHPLCYMCVIEIHR